MKLKDLFENKEYTFADWKKDLLDVYTSQASSLASSRIVNCSDSEITSLEGAPTNVDKFFCQNTKIKSLKFAPKHTDTVFNCTSNKHIHSLENIHHYIQYIGGHFFAHQCPIKSNVLGVLWIGCDEQGRPQPDGKAPRAIKLDNKQVEDILNKYLDKIHSKEMTPRGALIHAQGELQDANLDEYADL